MPFYEKQPYIQPLHQLIKEVMIGEIRVPRFQRPGSEESWTPEQRGELLDSLYQGFPVGTILLWSTPTQIFTRDTVGGFRLPVVDTTSRRRPLRLLLDGHQRLSTVVRILGPGLMSELAAMDYVLEPEDEPEGEEDVERWVFDLAPEVDAEVRFVRLRSGDEAGNHQLPLGIVLDRTKLNRWLRNRSDKLTEQQIRDADSVRDRLREYSMPVAVLIAENLDKATESFKRINSAGTPMSAFHMVSALAYQTDFDLQEQIEDYRTEKLEEVGWRDVSDSDLLRVCAGLIPGEHPSKIRAEKIAKALRDDRTLLERAIDAVVRAAGLLAQLGVHGPAALPYSWQMITLAIAFGRQDLPENLDSSAELGVNKWFWLTTYGEVFAGVNSAVYNRGLLALKEITENDSWKAMERDLAPKVVEVKRFDFRAARAKACALAMANVQDCGDKMGLSHRALKQGVTSVQVLATRGRRSTWWHLAIVSDSGEYDIAKYRYALRRFDKGKQTKSDSELLRKLGFEVQEAPTAESLLQDRRERILAHEREIVSGLGLTWENASSMASGSSQG